MHPGWGDVFPPIYFEGGDHAFITLNIGRNCYAIVIKHLMSGDGWRECKSMLSIGDDLAKSQESHAETGYFYYDFMIENCCFL